MKRLFLLLLLSLGLMLGSGCMKRIGANLTAGFLEEAAGEGESPGIEEIADSLVERAIAQKLGEQLTSGAMAGLGEITPEQRQSLEDTIDAALLVAARRTGSGLRDEVSPQLREMVKQDIVNALVEGFRGDVADSLEDMAARLVNTLMYTVRMHIEDPDLREAIGEMLRDSIYLAMREGGTNPAVGETIETTLSENMLTPFESSVSGLADEVANRVDESNKRLEQMMKGIISALVIVLGVFILLYSLNRRQLVRAREDSAEDRQRYRAMGAAIQLLDDDTREAVMGTAEGIAGQAIALPTAPTGVRIEQPRNDSYVRGEEAYAQPQPQPPPEPSDDYER